MYGVVEQQSWRANDEYPTRLVPPQARGEGYSHQTHFPSDWTANHAIHHLPIPNLLSLGSYLWRVIVTQLPGRGRRIGSQCAIVWQCGGRYLSAYCRGRRGCVEGRRGRCVEAGGG